MKLKSARLLTLCLTLVALPLVAQMGTPSGPRIGADMAKIFGDHKTFSADLEFEMKGGPAGAVTMPGKLGYHEGKSRFEMDMTQMKSDKLPPGAAEGFKEMGMDKLVMISRPEKKVSYLIYPGMSAYVEMPMKDTDAALTEADYTAESTELGKETVAGRACVKNKVVITDKAGKQTEATVWNATDLKKFPVRIETEQDGHPVVMLFKDVKFAAPAADQFDPPADFTKYTSIMTLMQQEMMKRMGGGAGVPPPGR